MLFHLLFWVPCSWLLQSTNGKFISNSELNSLSLLSHSYLFPRMTVNNIPTMQSCTRIPRKTRCLNRPTIWLRRPRKSKIMHHEILCRNFLSFEHCQWNKMCCCFRQTKFYALHRHYIQPFLDYQMMLHSNVVWQTIFNEIYCFIFSVGRYHL